MDRINIFIFENYEIVYRFEHDLYEFIFSKLPFWKCDQKELQLTPTRWKLTAKRSNIFPKLSDPCAKSFAPSDHKHFTCAKKPPKNPARQLTLSEKPPLFSTFIQIFSTFLWGYSNECRTTLKSRWENVAGINRSAKVRSPRENQALEVRMKLACEWNEIVHKKKKRFFWGKKWTDRTG